MNTTANIEPEYKQHSYDELLKLSIRHSIPASQRLKIRRELAVRYLTEVSVLEARTAMYKLKDEPYFTRVDQLEIITKSRDFVSSNNVSKQSLINNMNEMISTIEAKLKEAA